MGFLLWIVALLLVVAAVVEVFRGQIILAVVFIILACLVGPGGYSLFR